MFDFLKNFFKIVTKPLIGIDISSSSVKIVELVMEGEKYRLNKYGTELLPDQSVVENNIMDTDNVANVIKNLIERLNIDRPYAAIAVSGSSVLTRIIHLQSTFGDTHIEEQIAVEADRYVPYPIEEVYYDFEVQGISIKQSEYNDILLACARKETVDSRLDIIQKAGLKATIVDVESLVIERVFQLIANPLKNGAKHKNVALIDIGDTMTSLHVFKNLKSIYSRDQMFGSKQLADEIQIRYGFSFETAIDRQKKALLSEDYAASVLEPFKETVTQQITRALQVFFSSSEEGEVHELVMAGDVADMPGLIDLIKSSTGLPVSIANPFKNMIISEEIDRQALKKDAPCLLVSCGLALRNFD